MIRRKMICSILSYCLMLSFECGLIEGSMDDRFRAYRVEQSVSAAEQQLMNQFNADATGGNRLCCDWGEFKRKFESGPATYGLSSSLNLCTIYRSCYINTVNLLISHEDAEGIDNAYNSAIRESDRRARKAHIKAVSDSIQEKFIKPLAVLEEQMKLFYEYITRAYKPSVLPPKWNWMPSVNGNPERSTHSATHTEFLMVYKILQDKGMPRREDGLLQMNSVENFREALDTLKGKLPKEIYSVKAMCPVCEAFLTSLYNLCGCEGVFISNLDDYNSPSGPEGALKKVYLNKTKDGTYVDLPPDHEKKPRQAPQSR